MWRREERRSTLTRRASLNDWSEKDDSSLLNEGEDVRFVVYLLVVLTIDFEVEECWQLIVVVEDHWQTLYPEQSIRRQSKHSRRVTDEKHLFDRTRILLLLLSWRTLVPLFSLSTSVDEWLFRVVDWIFTDLFEESFDLLRVFFRRPAEQIDQFETTLSEKETHRRRWSNLEREKRKGNQRGLTRTTREEIGTCQSHFFLRLIRPARNTNEIDTNIEKRTEENERRIVELPFSLSVDVGCLEEEKEKLCLEERKRE